MGVERPVTTQLGKTRSLDASVRNLVIESTRAVAGLVIAFSVAWWVSDAIGESNGAQGFVVTASLFVATALVALTITSGRPLQRSLAVQWKAIADEEERLRSTSRGHQFQSDLHEALEMSEDEASALEVVGRALDLTTGGPGEMLLADSSRTHLRQAVTGSVGEPPGCDVATSWGCPAVRRGHALEFSSNRDLAVCPHLRDRPEEVSALCIPVTVLGTPMGVIHLTGEPNEPLDPAARSRAESIARQAGDRIGLFRAMATSQLAAATDSLTGQMNRRSIEEELRLLDQAGTPYAIAFVDLDHFKILNDTHGHAAGDRALRHFATVASSTVRTGDFACRYGGEEFLLVYVGCDVTRAAPIVHRLRDDLAQSILAAGVPPFTVSVGLADSTYGSGALEVVAYADSALLTAKREGRNRLIIASREGPSDLAMDILPVPR